MLFLPILIAWSTLMCSTVAPDPPRNWPVRLYPEPICADLPTPEWLSWPERLVEALWDPNVAFPRVSDLCLDGHGLNCYCEDMGDEEYIMSCDEPVSWGSPNETLRIGQLCYENWVVRLLELPKPGFIEFEVDRGGNLVQLGDENEWEMVPRIGRTGRRNCGTGACVGKAGEICGKDM
ncbi:MAG: hypothetical protein M1824_006097 [Vezdaea acicularis]|nr:MAG: hypothetical protein M1824_006097 [Vezdaea acicularis]